MSWPPLPAPPEEPKPRPRTEGPGVSPAWNVFVFNKNDDGQEWRRQRVADWRLEDAVRWAARRGDTILIEKDPEPTWSIRGITSHSCRDRDCPGGCP